jgi:hypothetical protein
MKKIKIYIFKLKKKLIFILIILYIINLFIYRYLKINIFLNEGLKKVIDLDILFNIK